MPRNDQETFAHLISNPNVSYEINLLSYALFADEKAKWVEHFTALHGSQPSSADTENWVSNITDQHFEHMRLKAARFFDAAAREYLAKEFDQEKKEVLQSKIISEVKAAGAFWRQMAIAILTAVLAPVIIGGIIAAFLAYNEVFPTFIRVPTQIDGTKG
ncbi:hypothetical protein [Aureimonas psammosilenae]|uniref:hypothetical protein n=1 Tax=Aureimonas psammosilenae TaxID=2495496 RepID=UPI001260E189|nr:hypothetical protein [Aureimonas psammosilenae]